MYEMFTSVDLLQWCILIMWYVIVPQLQKKHFEWWSYSKLRIIILCSKFAFHKLCSFGMKMTGSCSIRKAIPRFIIYFSVILIRQHFASVPWSKIQPEETFKYQTNNHLSIPPQISNGPTYKIKLSGSGIAPGLHFSFLSHNFGPSFIYHAGLPYKSKKLMLTNRDKKEIRYSGILLSTSILHPLTLS